MKERHINESRLGAISETPPATISRLLAKKIQNPSSDTILALAKGLGVTTTELLGEAKSADAITLAITANNRAGLLREISSTIGETPRNHDLLSGRLDIMGSISFVANKDKNIARITIYLEAKLPRYVIWDLRDAIKRDVRDVHQVRVFVPGTPYEVLNPEEPQQIPATR
jgi:transcriptional regulator with XRE-family HTH domain